MIILEYFEIFKRFNAFIHISDSNHNNNNNDGKNSSNSHIEVLLYDAYLFELNEILARQKYPYLSHLVELFFFDRKSQSILNVESSVCVCVVVNLASRLPQFLGSASSAPE